ncbi:MAG: hypothetical protein M3Y85_11230 [Bacteroidota bacterium]|nr:hypothetical protein [Bacteroidota bacterium]
MQRWFIEKRNAGFMQQYVSALSAALYAPKVKTGLSFCCIYCDVYGEEIEKIN